MTQLSIFLFLLPILSKVVKHVFVSFSSGSESWRSDTMSRQACTSWVTLGCITLTLVCPLHVSQQGESSHSVQGLPSFDCQIRKCGQEAHECVVIVLPSGVGHCQIVRYGKAFSSLHVSHQPRRVDDLMCITAGRTKISSDSVAVMQRTILDSFQYTTLGTNQKSEQTQWVE